MQDIVSIWYLVVRKLCLVVDSQVKIWSYKYAVLQELSSTLLCLQHHFGNILTKNICEVLVLFWFWSIGNNTSIFKKWRIMSLSHPHWKVSRTSDSLMWEISKQLKVFSCFNPTKFDLLLFYLMERRTSATYNISQVNCVVFGWFFNKC